MPNLRVHNLVVSLDGYATGEDQSLEAAFGHAQREFMEWFGEAPDLAGPPPGRESSARSTRPPWPPGAGSPTTPGRRSATLARREVASACSLAPGSQVRPADQRRITGGVRASRPWFIHDIPPRP